MLQELSAATANNETTKKNRKACNLLVSGATMDFACRGFTRHLLGLAKRAGIRTQRKEQRI